MRKFTYLTLITKKFARTLPFLLGISAALLFCAFFAFSFFAESEKDKNTKIEIAIVGDPEDSYLSMGMAALKNFDSSRFAISITMMEEEEAQSALQWGRLTAYIVVPEDFVMNAFYGEVGRLKYVTKHGSAMMGDFIKEEVLDVISIILVESQRGIYASGNLARDLIEGRKYGEVTDLAALEYVNMILARNKLFDTEIVENVDGIGIIPSVFCGAVVFILLLFGIGAAGVLGGRNDALSMSLRAKGFGIFDQIICEYSAFLILLSIATGLMLGGSAFLLGEKLSDIIGYEIGKEFLISAFLSLAMLTAFLLLVFEMTNGIMAGALTHFFASLFLCYFSGCLYPITFFPTALQKLSAFMPTGCARSVLIASLTGDDISAELLVLGLYLALFISLCAFFRFRRIAIGGGEE